MKTTQPRRSRRSASEWALLVEEFKTSSLTLTAFCEQADVSLSQFYNWRRKLRADAARVDGGFTPVRLRAASATSQSPVGGRIEVRLKNGRIVRVVGAVDAQVLREVMLMAEGGA